MYKTKKNCADSFSPNSWKNKPIRPNKQPNVNPKSIPLTVHLLTNATKVGCFRIFTIIKSSIYERMD